jgi:lactoylglutathione lyase
MPGVRYALPRIGLPMGIWVKRHLATAFVGMLFPEPLGHPCIWRDNYRTPCKLNRGEEVVMVPIRGVYEVAIRVKQLPRAEAFYRQILGLEVGLRDEKRNWLFLQAGGQEGMIVLQEDPGEWPTQHFAFRVDETEIEEAAAMLGAKGVAVDGPVFHSWMPAKSVYFSDPDGHDLELCAPLTKEAAELLEASSEKDR